MNVDVWKFLQDNIYLVLIAVLSGGMLLWPLLRRGGMGPMVNTLEATLLINQKDAVLIDVRDAADVPPGAVSIWLTSIAAPLRAEIVGVVVPDFAVLLISSLVAKLILIAARSAPPPPYRQHRCRPRTLMHRRCRAP